MNDAGTGPEAGLASADRRADLEWLAEEVARRYRELKGDPAPSVVLQFYPYVNLNHTIRLRQGRVIIRLSDILEEAPRPVLSAISSILVFKLLRRRVPEHWKRLYRDWACRSDVRERCLQVRRMRGRKSLTSEQGRRFDLRRICEELNLRYFGGQLRIRRLSWSRKRNRRILGHYDDAHNTIVIDRRLDSPQVPRYVVEFVVYHEMLHAFFGEEVRNGRRWVHHRPFREAERRFHDYERAQSFIRRL